MIDPSIPLGVQPPKIDTPFEVQQKRIQLGSLMTGQALQQIQLQQAQRGVAGQQAERQAVSDNMTTAPDGTPTPDTNKTVAQLIRGGYVDEALRVQQGAQQQRVLQLQQQKDLVESKQRNADMIARVASTVKATPPELKQAAWDQGARFLKQAGIPEADGYQGMPYDDAHLDVLINMSQTASAQHDAVLKDLDVKIKQEQADAEKAKGTAALTEANTKQDEWTTKKPGVQADTVQQQMQTASMQLASAKSQQDYQAKFSSLPPEVAANFPPPQSWQGARTGAAVIKAGMTPVQQTAAANEQQRTAIAGGELNLNQRRFSMLEGPQAIDTWVNSMKDDPDTWKDVPPQLKTAVATQWSQTTGLPVPRPLPTDVKSREEASQQSLSHIQNVRQLLNDPDFRGAIGPVLGRLGTMEQNVGDTFFKSGAQAQKEQQLRTALSYLFGQEGRALFGGRPPEKLMQELHKSSANPAMSLNMMLGALDGAEGSAQRTISTAQQYRFNGKTLPGTPLGGSRKSLDDIFGGQR